MKRRRRQEGGVSISEDESMEQVETGTPAAKSSDPVAAATVVADDAVAASGGQIAAGVVPASTGSLHHQMGDGSLPLDTLLSLPLPARWTPLSLRVRLWHNERRRTLSGDKRPKLSDLPAFLASHSQYRVHHDETRVLQVLELAKDGIDGVHERHCAKCRSAQRPKSMVVCQTCTYVWHRECLDKPITQHQYLVCDECIRRNPFNFLAHHQRLQSSSAAAVAAGSEQPPTESVAAPITVQVSKKFKTKHSETGKKAESATVVLRKGSRDSNGTAVVDAVVEAPPPQPAIAAPAPAPLVVSCASETNVFSRENFRLLFNFLSKLMDNGFISKHEQGLMKNLIIARDAQAVLMLSIVDIVEEGGDLNDAVDSLRRILLVS